MPNRAGTLKSEIVRLARREIRAEIAALQRASAAHRRDIAALKRRNSELLRTVQSLSKRGASGTTSVGPVQDAGKLRFRADGLRALRKKLDLSAEDVAALLGVSAQSVYTWEHGRSKPRRSQLPAIAELRSMGKREAHRRLAEAKTKQAAAR